MSKRFGRNQKRKLTAELKESHAALVNQINTSQSIRKEQRHLEYELKQVIDLVERFSRNSAAIPPKSIEGNDRDSYRLPIFESSLFANVSSFMPSTSMRASRTIDLHKLEMHIEDNLENFQNCVHIKFGNFSRSPYAMSFDAFVKAPSHYVVHNIANSMVSDMQNKYLAEKFPE
jgi:hypothetical protein